MGSLNVKTMGHTSKLESDAGTFLKPTSPDNDTVIWGDGLPTPEFNNEVLGMLANSSMDEAPVAGGNQTLTLPDAMFFLQHSGGAGLTEPKNWKYMKAAGYKVVDNTQLAIVFNCQPSCNTLSTNVQMIDCAGTGYEYEGRGMKGNLVIGADGANKPIICTLGGLQGAYVGKKAITGGGTLVVVGNDVTPREVMARYVANIDSILYQVSVWSHDPQVEITYDIANNTSGILTAKGTGKQQRVNMTVVQLSAGDSILETAQDHTINNIPITIIGGAGAGYDITFSDCEILTATLGDVDGTVGWEIQATTKKAIYQMKDLSV